MTKPIDAPGTPAGRRQPSRRRNKGFEETHGVLIDTAVRLMSEKGTEALSLSEVAREAGVNRTTVYYHFDSRDALLVAVREWSANQLAAAFAPSDTAENRTRFITRFVLENPEVIALWTEEFLAPGRIGNRYPHWDALVAGLREQFAEMGETDIDAESFSTLLLTWAMIGPRVYRNSVRPDLPLDDVVERLAKSQLAMLRLIGVTPGRDITTDVL
ncbi:MULTISPECIES: TetR/AcrR family transcriptional regulator [Novosphingobium]|uniref:TetR/AcrR family transcriptional regulator n=1 Tax=Novosphingobium sp. TaxID=1874826 RepID=UPI0012C64A01|nr:TetR/AcrR family transcriptional regulator [Novosphingobium sp.]MPS69109.1 TetR/AcrR family transcriptional regulator [Novosphingobium sp.]